MTVRVPSRLRVGLLWLDQAREGGTLLLLVFAASGVANLVVGRIWLAAGWLTLIVFGLVMHSRRQAREAGQGQRPSVRRIRYELARRERETGAAVHP